MSDKVTQEILDEMKSEGIIKEETPETKPAEEQNPEPKQEEQTKVEEQKPDEEIKLNLPTEEDDDGDSEEDDEVSDDDSEESENKNKRPVVLLSKHKKKLDNVRRTLAEKDEIINQLNKQLSERSEANKDKTLESLAEKTGLDKDAIAELVKIARGDTDNVAKELMELKEQQIRDSQDIYYQNDFNKNVLPDIREKYPEASQKAVEIVQSELKKLKFTKKLASIPLEFIFSKYQSEFEKVLKPKQRTNVGLEEKKPHNHREEVTDYENVTEDDIKKMSSAEFDKYSDWITEKTKKNRFQLI